MRSILYISFILICLLSSCVQQPMMSTEEQAALDVINRFTRGQVKVRVDLNLEKTDEGCDTYSYSATADEVSIQASSAVAACRGFYDYVKSKDAGYCGWGGSRFVVPKDLSHDTVSLTTQFRDHQYLNVVTYGYTTPYWDEARWDQEIDWMALHGIDMPLMLVGAEQIYREVFYDLGLTKAEVDAWEVGPAHLPWFRMGNLAGNSFDGPLGEEWNTRQRELAHHLLDRMRALGMKPICPAFGGFVPEAFNKHPEGDTDATGWDWMPTEYRNHRLSPNTSAFVEVGRRFIQKWEEEYGMGQYYLSDSFNEMSIPDDTTTLTHYADSIFKSISEGSANPNAVWVTQGWTFVYQHQSWGNTKFKALTKNIPNDRFMVLYMSPEYGPHKCWERYDGFDGKPWCYTMLPNMGGKTFWNGDLNDYASNYLNDLYASPSKGNCTGYGITAEGVENNELLYELICDAGWMNANDSIDIESWLEQYARCRYGLYNKTLKDLFSTLQNTVYSHYIDHPRFGWQVGNNITGTGNATLNDEFYAGVEALFSNIEELKSQNSPLLAQDLIELAVLYVSGYIEKISAKILATDNSDFAASLIDDLDNLMLDMDAALDLHPLYSLQRWESMAQNMADSDTTRLRNVRNARRIVTIWYGNHTYDEPVRDYASRIWSGLVRDFYRPRLINTLKKKHELIPTFDPIEFENQFVNSAPKLTEVRKVDIDHIDYLAQLIIRAKDIYTATPR